MTVILGNNQFLNLTPVIFNGIKQHQRWQENNFTRAFLLNLTKECL